MEQQENVLKRGASKAAGKNVGLNVILSLISLGAGAALIFALIKFRGGMSLGTRIASIASWAVALSFCLWCIIDLCYSASQANNIKKNSKIKVTPEEMSNYKLSKESKPALFWYIMTIVLLVPAIAGTVFMITSSKGASINALYLAPAYVLGMITFYFAIRKGNIMKMITAAIEEHLIEGEQPAPALTPEQARAQQIAEAQRRAAEALAQQNAVAQQAAPVVEEAQPVAEPVAEVVETVATPEVVAEPVVEEVQPVEPVVAPVETVAETIVPEVEPVVEEVPAVEPVAEVVETVATPEVVVEPVVEEVQPVVEPIVAPVVEPVVQPVVAPVVEPVATPVVETVAEAVAPAMEDIPVGEPPVEADEFVLPDLDFGFAEPKAEPKPAPVAPSPTVQIILVTPTANGQMPGAVPVSIPLQTATGTQTIQLVMGQNNQPTSAVLLPEGVTALEAPKKTRGRKPGSKNSTTKKRTTTRKRTTQNVVAVEKEEAPVQEEPKKDAVASALDSIGAKLDRISRELSKE